MGSTGEWNETKLMRYDKVGYCSPGLGDTCVNICTVIILIIEFYLVYLVTINLADSRLDLGSNAASYCSGSGGATYTQAR